MLPLRKSLKTMLLLAILSICSPNAWAQDEAKPSFAKIRYVHSMATDSYLSEIDQWDQICIRASTYAKTFHVDTISKGRYVVVADYVESSGYVKGRFWFNNSEHNDLGEPLSQEIINNCYFSDEFRLETSILSVEAIRFGNTLYVTEIPNAEYFIPNLEKAAADGDIKKIDLSKANNFVFSFNKVDYDFLPQNHNYMAITSEIGGEVMIDDFSGFAKVITNKHPSTNSSMFDIEAVDNPYIDDPIYRRLDFGEGDNPYTLEIKFSGSYYNYSLYENSGDYLNANNQSDRYGSSGGRVYNKDGNGEYIRDSLGNVLSFLGVNNIMQYGASTNYAFYVDTAYVNRGTGVIKPQYMIAVDKYIPKDANGEYVIGRYLYNASMYSFAIDNLDYTDKYFDKTKGEGIQVSENETESGYLLKSNNFNKAQPVDPLITRNPNGGAYRYESGFSRFAFAWAIHKGDSLYVLKGAGLEPVYNGADNDPHQLWLTLSKEYGIEGKSIDFSKLINENIVQGSEYKEAYWPLGDKSVYPEMRTYYDYKPATALSPGKTIGLQAIIALDDNTHKDWVFSFRLIEKGSSDFLIESETTFRNTHNSPLLRPEMGGGWITLRNGVPLVSYFFDRLIDVFQYMFNVTQTDNPAVSNEAVNTLASAKSTVISGTGNITILNAANKNVVISDILGRTISNTTVSSDNEIIAVPSGAIIVVIEGENATKVIVR